jgi:hypothetical protein
VLCRGGVCGMQQLLKVDHQTWKWITWRCSVMWLQTITVIELIQFTFFLSELVSLSSFHLFWWHFSVTCKNIRRLMIIWILILRDLFWLIDWFIVSIESFTIIFDKSIQEQIMVHMLVYINMWSWSGTCSIYKVYKISIIGKKISLA